MYGWRTTEDGMVLVWDLPNGPERAPMLAPAQAAQLESVEARWGDICRAASARHGLPDGWLQAMIWRESNGNPRAYNPDGGRGLLQITAPALKAGKSDEQLYDPVTNIEIGAHYLAYLARRYADPDGRFNFPKASAAFNAGSVRESSQNPWGMVQTTGHVSSEVAALNTWLSRSLSAEQKAQVLASVWLTSDAATDDFAAGSPLPDDDVPPTDRNS